MKPIVLLTATVQPHITSHLTISAASARRDQYVQALGSWTALAERGLAKIVLVENSGTSKADFTGRGGPSSSRFQFLAAPAPAPEVAQRGKGAAEADMIDWAVQNLSIGSDDLLFKCTGRLFVRNFEALRRSWHRGDRLVLDLPSRRPFAWCDSRFFGASGSTWSDDLRGMGDSIDDEADHVFEHVLAERAQGISRSFPRTVVNFDESPWIVGLSGTSGRAYSSSRLKSLARPLLRIADRTRRGRAASL